MFRLLMQPVMRFVKHLAVIALVLGLGAGMATAEVVAVVSAQSPVTTLSRNQVMDIFLGKCNHFPNGEQAIPIDQAEGSALRNEFYLKFSAKSAAQLKAYWSKIIFTGRGQPPKEISGSIEVKKFIAGHPHAIGYIDQSDLDDNVKALTILH